MKKRLLPIGMSDYKHIIEKDCYYVDKTLLVKDVMESGSVILITRPRRFGKTLNQTMMRYFFEKTEENHSYLFENKKIWKEVEYRELQGKFPVIYLTFKDVKSSFYEKSYREVVQLLSNEYKRHRYLLDSIESGEDKKVFSLIMSREARIEDYQESLLKLSEYLYLYYGERAVLLIDEYDTPILASYNSGYYKEFIDFFKVVLSSALKDNKFLEKSVLTGITRLAKESLFSGLNNLDVSTILSDYYSDKFGLLEEEVREMLEYYDLEYEEERVIEWYNGYKVGEESVFNPYSITNLVHHSGKIKEYWVNSSGNDLIKTLVRESSVEFKDKIMEIIDGKAIDTEIVEDLVFNDLRGKEEHIWTLLLFSGYLKWVEQTGHRKYLVKAPNQEVLFFYRYMVSDILKDKDIRVEKIINKLLLKKIKTFKVEFKDLLLNSLSYFDVSGKEPERFYHGLILGMMTTLDEKYIIKSNRETGLGRADLILIPKDKNGIGVVLEFKKYDIDSDKGLLDCAKKGLKQIDEKKYIEEIKSYGVEDVVTVALAFNGKEVEIVSNLDKEEKIVKKELSEKGLIAKSLLESGIDIKIVSMSTGITIEELKKL